MRIERLDKNKICLNNWTCPNGSIVSGQAALIVVSIIIGASMEPSWSTSAYWHFPSDLLTFPGILLTGDVSRAI